MKEIALAKNIFLSNFSLLKFPYKLTFAATYRCNSRCQICHIWQRKSKKEMTTWEIKNFFQKNNFFNWVDLTGGEVFLRSDLVDICKAIISHCQNLYLLHIPTNGLMTKKIDKDVKKILELKPHKFMISIAIDGSSSVHDKLRGVKDSWQKAEEAYQRLKKIKNKNFEVYFGMTLSGYNYQLIEETYQSLKKVIKNLKRNEIHFNLAHYSDVYYDNLGVKLQINNEIDYFLKEFLKKKEKVFSSFHWLENRYQTFIKEYLKNKKSPLSCLALRASIFIDPFGNIYPCSIWNKKIANLRDDDFDLKKIITKKEIVKIKNLIKLNQCPGCWTPCEAYQTILGNLLHL